MELNDIIKIALDTYREAEDKEAVLITAMEAAYIAGKLHETEERLEEYNA